MAPKVMIVSALDGWTGSGRTLTPVWVQLDSTDPKMKTLYWMDTNDSQLYECNVQSNTFQSFLVNNSVVSDGNYYVLTPLDVLFVVLPAVMNKRKHFHSLFEILNDILGDKEVMAKIDKSLKYQTMASIADIKYNNEEMYIRYNSQKTMEWLSKKIDNTVNAFTECKINVSCDGSKVSGYKSGKEDPEREKAQYTRMAFELIAKYLSDELSNELSKQLRLSDETKDTNKSMTSTQIKRKIDENESSGPLEDYSSYRGGTNSSTTVDKKPAKMSRSQKELLKVDKTGMKSISSFFTKKSK